MEFIHAEPAVHVLTRTLLRLPVSACPVYCHMKLHAALRCTFEELSVAKHMSAVIHAYFCQLLSVDSPDEFLRQMSNLIDVKPHKQTNPPNCCLLTPLMSPKREMSKTDQMSELID